MNKTSFELSPIKAMELAAAKVPNVISLAQGIPSFPTPQVIKDFVIQKINQSVCDKYSLTIGLSELREEIALSLNAEKLNYDPETEILATAGSIEGITAALLSCTAPGDEVILPSPSYVSYQGAIGIARCKAVFAPLDEDNNFDFDVDAMQRAISPKTKVILYCSPNNPTGTLFSEAKTRQILQLAEKHNLIILVDEVYKDFYYANEKHFSIAHINEARKRVIRVCSFSKAYAMTGWRIGFVHSDKSLLQPMLKFHDAMVTCAPVASQYAAIAALRFGAEYLEDFKKQFKERRDYTIKVLDSLSHILDYQMPLAAYFVFPRIKDTVPLARDSRKLAYDILEKAKLALVPGIAFGPSGESHLRITFGREKADLEEGLERLKKYFSQNRKHEIPKNILSKHRETGKHSLAKNIMLKLLALSAKIYLMRCKPKVIGIAGLRGKTVYKRYLSNLLTKESSVRANLLSYNTKTGFPLAAMNLENAYKDKISFLLKLIKTCFLPAKEKQILILEYGISDTSDSRHLLSIKKPDWLIITDITTGDPSFEYRDVLSGIRHLAENVDQNHIIWSFGDPLLDSLELNLTPELAVKKENIPPDFRTLTDLIMEKPDKVVGNSAQKALLSSIILCNKIGIRAETITKHLQELT